MAAALHFAPPTTTRRGRPKGPATKRKARKLAVTRAALHAADPRAYGRAPR